MTYCKTDPGTHPESLNEAALWWYAFGFNVIPLVPGSKKPAVKWNPWIDRLGPDTIHQYWQKHPDHELGFIAGSDIIVFDADTVQAIAALYEIEEAFDVTPSLIIWTTRGQHHYFSLLEGTAAKSDSHSTDEHPERIDIKTGRSLVVLPPSTGKEIHLQEADSAADLTSIGQDFVDAVYRHNGRLQSVALPASSLSDVECNPFNFNAEQLKALIDQLDADCGYDDWLHTGMATYHATGGSQEGLEIYDAWSSTSAKYPGFDEIQSKWTSFANPSGAPITIATILRMLAMRGHDWMDVLDKLEPGFETCHTEVVYPGSQNVHPSRSGRPSATDDVLKAIQGQFSLANMSGKVWG